MQPSLKIAVLICSFLLASPSHAGWFDFWRGSASEEQPQAPSPSQHSSERQSANPAPSPEPTPEAPADSGFTATIFQTPAPEAEPAGETPAPILAPEEFATPLPTSAPRVEESACKDAPACVRQPRLPAPNFLAIAQGPARVKAFSDYYGPQAVALQKATGYPASLMLSQWAEESGWGSSLNYRQQNNIAGHRCWKSGERKMIQIKIPGMEGEIPSVCSRFAKGGILYYKFENPIDSTLDYINNILYADNTADAYKSIRAAVRKARPGVAEWKTLMPGLRAYCPWDQYQRNIPKILNTNGFAAWEKKVLCGCPSR